MSLPKISSELVCSRVTVRCPHICPRSTLSWFTKISVLNDSAVMKTKIDLGFDMTVPGSCFFGKTAAS